MNRHAIGERQLRRVAKLREDLRARKDPKYVPGSIPIAEIATHHGVSVYTVVSAYQADGKRGIDDLSLLTPNDAASAKRALRKFQDLKDPQFAPLRRDGFVPVTEFTFTTMTPLNKLLDACVAVGFSQNLATADLWLDQYEQRLVQNWLADSSLQPHDTSTPLPLPTATSLTAAPTDAIHAPAVKKLLEGIQKPHFLEPPASTTATKWLPVDKTRTPEVKQAVKHDPSLVQPKVLTEPGISERSLERDLGDISLRNLNQLLGDRIMPPAPEFPVFKSPIGRSSVEVRQLQRTLDLFTPSSYGEFFHQMLAALRVDAKIRRSMNPSEVRQKHWTDPAHAKFITEICNYKYGIFAYADAGTLIGSKPRKSMPQNRKSLTTSLHKFRPMYKGLLTDESRRQFILWRVGEGTPDLLVIKWDALSGWLDGMESGHYVGLRARYVRVAGNLSGEDQEVVMRVVAMADNLRAGTRRASPQPVKSSPKGHIQLAGHRTTAPRALGYKPESQWLVPITISGRTVSTGLDDDFFTEHGGKRAHQVRSFYRREPGTPLNAPRTVLVNGHVRGGRLFEDARLLPAVTIRRKR